MKIISTKFIGITQKVTLEASLEKDRMQESHETIKRCFSQDSLEGGLLLESLLGCGPTNSTIACYEWKV